MSDFSQRRNRVGIGYVGSYNFPHLAGSRQKEPKITCSRIEVGFNFRPPNAVPDSLAAMDSDSGNVCTASPHVR